MKVSDLLKGQVLRIQSKNRCAWLTIEHPHPCGDPELRFGPVVMKPLLNNVVDLDALIIYLGHDKISTDPQHLAYKQLVRRVMINEKTAVVLGHNFKHLEMHPDFN